MFILDTSQTVEMHHRTDATIHKKQFNFSLLLHFRTKVVKAAFI